MNESQSRERSGKAAESRIAEPKIGRGGLGQRETGPPCLLDLRQGLGQRDGRWPKRFDRPRRGHSCRRAMAYSPRRFGF
jgi:hypothetical protein